jgi:hypothetical protein
MYSTTTYAPPSYHTVAPKYYNDKAEYHTTTYTAPVYYTDESICLIERESRGIYTLLQATKKIMCTASPSPGVLH